MATPAVLFAVASAKSLAQLNPPFVRKHALEIAALGVGALVLGVMFWHHTRRAPRASGPLPHEVYVWQRAWTAPVREAVVAHATNFNEVVVLAAEVNWKNGAPQVTRVELDHAALKKAGSRIGLALRIGPYAGPFRSDDRVAQFLASLAQGIVMEAQTNGLDPVELHMLVSSLCFYNVSNQYTFSVIFKADMASPGALAARRESVVRTVVASVKPRTA